jgi:2-keto-3-deoxy-6-phosphogluconate aldolase
MMIQCKLVTTGLDLLRLFPQTCCGSPRYVAKMSLVFSLWEVAPRQ